MIRLIATDLDGTLFYPKRKFRGMCSENIHFLREYLSDGGKLVLVSGRNSVILPRVEKVLGYKVSLLGCNGAFLKEDDKMKIAYPMDKELLLDFYSYCHGEFDLFNMMLFNETPTTFIAGTERMNFLITEIARFINNTNGFYKENLVKGEKIFLDAIVKYDTYKIMPFVGFGKKSRFLAETIKLAIKTKYSGRLNAVTSGGAIEITHPEANKGKTLLNYCRMNGIDTSEVFVCGDSGNDLPMFACFHHSFCMSHSPSHISSQANHVINRVADLKEYLLHPETYEKDILHPIDYDKALKGK